MKLKFSIALYVLFCAPFTYAELPQCARTGYTTCSVNESCASTIHAGMGRCFKLVDIVQGKKYNCAKSGYLNFNRFDFDSAAAAGLIANPRGRELGLDASGLKTSSGVAMFAIENTSDTPDNFSISCSKIN